MCTTTWELNLAFVILQIVYPKTHHFHFKAFIGKHAACTMGHVQAVVVEYLKHGHQPIRPPN